MGRIVWGKQLKGLEPPPVLEPPSTLSPELGDLVEAALTAVGITKDRVSRWLGRDCGCERRREMLNRLSRWAKRVLSGKTDDAEMYLDKILEEPEDDPTP